MTALTCPPLSVSAVTALTCPPFCVSAVTALTCPHFYASAAAANLPWEQVVAQAPRFFELRHQGMKDHSRSSVGIFVLQEMHKCLVKSKGFPKLLSEISSSGILVLPGPALGP